MTECRVRPALVGAERLAKQSVTVTVGMGRAVFLPQQCQRHAFALELLRHRRPIRFAQVLWWASNPAEQSPLESRIILVNRRQWSS